MPKKADNSKQVKSYKHPASKRTNLPTEQTEPFMEDEQKASVAHSPPVREPGSIPRLSWDRDSSLDPLETPAYPLYIHEKLEPSIFINGLREAPDADQSGLWDHFNGFPENAAYEWYQHQGNWQNRIVRGNSTRVMGSLLAKEGMAGQVQMVYFDPPYGISFKSNFQVSTRSRNVGAGADALPNDQATISAFRDTYKNGIHSYLDGIYRNCVLARELLHESGSLFLQMGSANVHRLAVLLDEVFGPENRVATIPFAKSGGTSSATLPNVTDYLLWYAKDKSQCKYRQLYEPLTRQEKLANMSWAAYLELPDGSSRPLTDAEKKDVSLIPQGGRMYSRSNVTSIGTSTKGRSDDIVLGGVNYKCPPNSHWRVSKEGIERLDELGRLHKIPKTGSLRWKIFEDEVPGRRISNLWHAQLSADDIHYVVETDEEVIERCLLMATDPGDLVLDITCGSGTTAYVAEKWGRRWITTDTSGVAVSLARQRIATGFFDYYVLQDSPEGEALESSLSSKTTPVKPASAKQPQGHEYDLSKGFVCKRVPYVSAATLAYDQEAPHTLLVDQPYVKKSTIRVSSPFTVESESPYRYIAPNTTGLSTADHALDRIASIRSTLEQTGISWGDSRRPRMRFSEISDWLDAGGGYALISHVGAIEQEGTGDYASLGKAAIAIAPDDMTVSAAYINKAALAAVNMPGKIGALVVIAFEYEASVRSKYFEQRGKLKIFKAQANRDLLIENLKDEKGSYAFVMVGEPDVDIQQPEPGKFTVEVLGFDTYNPAIGNVLPGGAKDIDCWMLDTNYNGESFFARRVHFPNKSTDPQIAKLRKRLGSKLDRKAWDAMLSYKSLPFDRPSIGHIAVRIVTNTHTEMTTVIDCESIK